MPYVLDLMMILANEIEPIIDTKSMLSRNFNMKDNGVFDVILAMRKF